MPTSITTMYASIMIASVEGSSFLTYVSSTQAKNRIPAAAGQRPSQVGYSSAAGGSPLDSLREIHDAARATERHGLSARKMSPNSTLATTKPTQNTT